jgi:glutathione S-transferase
MIRAYGSSTSGNCWKVATVLKLTGQPFEWIEIDSNAGGARTPEYLALNPNGKVPIVELDDHRIQRHPCAFCRGDAVAAGARTCPHPGVRVAVL